MIPDTDRLAGILGAAVLEAIDRAVTHRLPELLAKEGGSAPEGLITAREVGKRTDSSPETVISWIPRGLVAAKPPGLKCWRFRWSDVEAFLSGAGQSTLTTPVLPPTDLGAKRSERAHQLAEGVRKDRR